VKRHSSLATKAISFQPPAHSISSLTKSPKRFTFHEKNATAAAFEFYTDR